MATEQQKPDHEFSETELFALKKAFDTFDEDRSETIDADELTKIMSLLGREVTPGEIIRMIASVDKNGTGVISYNDFLKLMWKRKKEKAATDVYRHVFRAINHNATQKLNSGELKQLCNQLNLDTTPEDVDEMIFEADEDEDHYVSFDEFVSMLQRALIDGAKTPSRRGWAVEHNQAIENWVKIANNIGSLMNQSACAKKCIKPQRLFRALNYPRASVHKEPTRNLQSLVSQCRDGDTVLLADGKYTDPVVIHHDGMTVGPQEGANVVIEVNSKQPAVTVKCRYAKLQNMTIINHDGPAVAIEQGYAELDTLSITGAQCGVLVKNRSFPAITNCNISNCARGAGVLLKESRANVENCVFKGNYDGAVVAERSCNPWISNCSIESGHNSGIVFTEGAVGVVVDCKISGNSTQGLYIDNGANPLVFRCDFTNGKASGIKMAKNSRATIQECTFENNGDHDIDCQEDGAPLVMECKFLGGNSTSIGVSKRGGITLERCNFASYPLSAVTVDDSRAIIVDNTFNCDPSGKTAKCGLVVQNNSLGKATNNFFVGWKPGIHDGRAAMQFAASGAFQFSENIIQETQEQADAENIVNLLGGDLMRRKSLRPPK